MRKNLSEEEIRDYFGFVSNPRLKYGGFSTLNNLAKYKRASYFREHLQTPQSRQLH